MEKVKNVKGENQTKLAMVLVGLIIVVIAITSIVLVSAGKKSNEKELDKSLKDMGKSFYENFYYEQIGTSADERTSLLSKFTTIGIKVDLENLGRYNNEEFKEDIKNFVNNKTKEKCNQTNTKVIIYPKSPYGKTDYKIETELDCGFEKSEK